MLFMSIPIISKSDPYLITNVKEFKEIENFEGDEYTYIYFRLVNDIDLAGECQEKEGWKPLVFSYGLQLDGNNKTIYGLNINRPNENKVGLFSRACCSVNNLTVVGQVVGQDSEGGLAGCSKDLRITNCTFKGEVIGNMSVVLLGIAIALLAKLPKVSIWVMLVGQGMSEDLPELQMVTQLLQQEKN